ncbi:ralA-binding protein 1-like [Mizuhopecten yessoensis]|uniref:ralA-binding protein 1-like n=1 Tax=Mizuhopecten yessoensis TaxID=6573 RepID=UPI000B45DF9D|nr:ralA-binding protein 1-like [Mizuhopecten yessoensis]
MNYDNTDADKSFQGDDDHEKKSRRTDLLLGKKRESKKGQGRYVMFDEEDSDESSIVSEDIKSPSKMKKSKAFRFSAKKKEKDEKKEKEPKKDERDKEKKKEDKEGKKLKLKTKKKSKHLHVHEEPTHEAAMEVEKPIFGVPLAVAVERNRSHDGIELPALFRDCVDYIEEHGLLCEGIYRISGVKSKVQMLKDSYNRQNPVYLEEHEPNIVASLLKTFLRELPEPVLTTSLMPKFEEASVIKNERRRLEQFSKLVSDLPTCNRLLLSWVIVHMMHVIERQKENKMTLQNVSIVLSPTMQISHRVLNVLFSLAKQLFKDIQLKRYKPPLRPTTSKWSLELPDNPAGLEEELAKQESLLNALHQEVSGVKDADKEEQLWEVQRVVTELKRKIKFAKKAADSEKRRREKEELRRSHAENDDMVLRLELREAPIKKQAPLPPNGDKANENPPSTETANEMAHLPEGEIQKCPAPPTAEKDVDVSEAIHEKEGPAVVSEVAANIEESGPPEDPATIPDDEEEEEEGDGSVTPVNVTEVPQTDTVVTITQESDVKGDNLPSVPVQTEKSDSEDSFEKQVEDILEQEGGAGDSSDEEMASLDVEVEKVKDAELKDQDVTVTVVKDQNKIDPGDEGEKDTDSDADDNAEIKDEGVITPTLKENESADTAGEETTGVITKTGEEVTGELTKTDEPAVVTKTQEEIEREAAALEEEIMNRCKEDVAEFEQPREVILLEDEVMSEEDEEILMLQDQENALRLEEEELVAIESELRKKIETERDEIERLDQEITELQYLRHDSDLEDMSSSSDSSYESEDEEDLQEILNQLLTENEELEKQNSKMCSQIHEERMICLEVKVQIGMIQQKQLESSMGSESMLERDLLLF